jgi:phosphoglucosamine mutase
VLEGYIFAWTGRGKPPSPQRLTVDEGLDRAYIQHLAETLPGGLSGMKIVVDAANGAASKLGPAVFEGLGAQVDCIHCAPDGKNINLDCGALHVEALRKRVLATGATLGVAFDGDADRAMFVDESGAVVDGDETMAMLAIDLQRRGALRQGAVVSTVMSNLGLEVALQARAVRLVRVPVGDRYVVDEMVRSDCNLGGEQSGHILQLDHTTTGDGLITALSVLRLMVEGQQPLSALKRVMTRFPQVLLNVRVGRRTALESVPAVGQVIARLERELGSRGRILVRYSGTEPLLRVMVEGEHHDRIEAAANEIAATAKAHLS